jgi:hypothetical protein
VSPRAEDLSFPFVPGLGVQSPVVLGDVVGVAARARSHTPGHSDAGHMHARRHRARLRLTTGAARRSPRRRGARAPVRLPTPTQRRRAPLTVLCPRTRRSACPAGPAVRSAVSCRCHIMWNSTGSTRSHFPASSAPRTGPARRRTADARGTARCRRGPGGGAWPCRRQREHGGRARRGRHGNVLRALQGPRGVRRCHARALPCPGRGRRWAVAGLPPCDAVDVCYLLWASAGSGADGRPAGSGSLRAPWRKTASTAALASSMPALLLADRVMAPSMRSA